MELGPENSHLAEEGGFDMVLAVTQASINATLKGYLDTLDRPRFRKVYVYDLLEGKPGKTYGPVETDVDALIAATGVDPFALPHDMPPSSPECEVMREHKVMFGFEIDLGLPLADLADIPDIVTLNSESSNVTYNMVFREFRIFEQAKKGGGFAEDWTWSVYDQPSDVPWTFTFSVQLSMREEPIDNDYDNLSSDAKKKIDKTGKDTFSIQKLYMVLNTAAFSNSPAISTLEPSSDTYQATTDLVEKAFRDTYFARAQKSGDVLLGYTVVQKATSKSESSIVPTNLCMRTSAYNDTEGKPTSDFGAYTLCYELVTQNKTLPKAVSFPWNWVPVSRMTDYHGVVAISKQVFTAYCEKNFSDDLQLVALNPTATFQLSLKKDGSKVGFVVNPVQTAQRYSVVDDDTSKVLTYSFEDSERQEDDLAPMPIWGSFELRTYTKSDVYFEGLTIKIVTDVRVFFKLNYEGGVSSGNWAHKKTTVVMTLGVTDEGHSTVTSSVEVEDLSEEMEVNEWSKFISLGTVDEALKKIKNVISSRVDTLMTRFTTNISNELNGVRAFVFPGGKTFNFKDMEFSNHGDLIARITYVQAED